jgi:hypothetical protein
VTTLIDLEAALIGVATPRFPEAVVRDELDNNLANELPTIQVEQIPGGEDDGLRLARALVDINTYAATRADAFALANRVHAWLTGELRGSTTTAAAFGRIAAITLPAIRPYENLGLRRVGATYEIFFHPVT